MRAIRLLAPLLLLPTEGCVAKTAFDVVTAPVRLAGKAVDLATTSQSEADEKRGRDIRRREERLGKLERDWRRRDAECRRGEAKACRERDMLREQMDALVPSVPYERSS